MVFKEAFLTAHFIFTGLLGGLPLKNTSICIFDPLLMGRTTNVLLWYCKYTFQTMYLWSVFQDFTNIKVIYQANYQAKIPVPQYNVSASFQQAQFLSSDGSTFQKVVTKIHKSRNKPLCDITKRVAITPSVVTGSQRMLSPHQNIWADTT